MTSSQIMHTGPANYSDC